MIWLSSHDEKLLNDLVSEVSADEMWKHMEAIMELSKEFPYMVAGSPGEESAFLYMKKELDNYGVPARILKFPAFIKTPLPSSLKIISPREMYVQCAPHRTIVSSPFEGIKDELIYIEPDHLGEKECKNKIVLTEEAGLRTNKIRLLQHMEAAGAVAISRDTFMPTVIHQSSDFSVSGNPTSKNYHLIPKLPMVKVSFEDGQKLKSLCMQSPVIAKMKACVDVRWKTQLILEAEVKGTKDPDKFVLVNGHVDTPLSPGVTDNVSGDVSMMEIARIFNKHKDKLDRSIRFCFWSGHETGAYAGSVWYNDEYWHDLRYNCLAFLNIDSPGAKGATEYSERGVLPSPELWDLVKKSIYHATGKTCETYRWPGRSGDRSFWGTGFPAVFLCATLPEEKLDPFVGFSGLGWWWHTPWATLDRADKDDLASNTKVYVDFIYTLCNALILPMNFMDMADKMYDILEDLNKSTDKIRTHFNLNPVLDRATEFKVQAEALENLMNKIKSGYESSKKKEDYKPIFAELNHCLMWVSRHLNLITCTDAEKTEQMSMEYFGTLPFPGLQPILDLAKFPLPYAGTTPEFMLMKTMLTRQRNKAEDGFVLAINEIKNTIEKVTVKLN